MEGLAHVALSRGDLPAARRLWIRALRTYPPGLAEARYVTEHLNAAYPRDATCFRCRSALRSAANPAVARALRRA
jgi:hypothetical protein